MWFLGLVKYLFARRFSSASTRILYTFVFDLENTVVINITFLGFLCSSILFSTLELQMQVYQSWDYIVTGSGHYELRLSLPAVRYGGNIPSLVQVFRVVQSFNTFQSSGLVSKLLGGCEVDCALPIFIYNGWTLRSCHSEWQKHIVNIYV